MTRTSTPREAENIRQDLPPDPPERWFYPFQGLVEGPDTQLLSLRTDNADLSCTNLVIDSRLSSYMPPPFLVVHPIALTLLSLQAPGYLQP